MRVDTLKSVAMPPRLFWAPFIIAAINGVIQLVFMIVTLVLVQLNPLWWVGSIVITHTVLIGYGAKEPHLSKIFVSYGKVPQTSQNMYKGKGVKLAS